MFTLKTFILEYRWFKKITTDRRNGDFGGFKKLNKNLFFPTNYEKWRLFKKFKSSYSKGRNFAVRLFKCFQEFDSFCVLDVFQIFLFFNFQVKWRNQYKNITLQHFHIMTSTGPLYCLSIGQEARHGVGTDTFAQIGNQRYQA